MQQYLKYFDKIEEEDNSQIVDEDSKTHVLAFNYDSDHEEEKKSKDMRYQSEEIDEAILGLKKLWNDSKSTDAEVKSNTHFWLNHLESVMRRQFKD